MSIKDCGLLLTGIMLLGPVYVNANSASRLYAVGGGEVTKVGAQVITAIAGQVLDDFSDKDRKRRPVVTPEPASLVLLGTGLVGVAAAIRWSKSKSMQT